MTHAGKTYRVRIGGHLFGYLGFAPRDGRSSRHWPGLPPTLRTLSRIVIARADSSWFYAEAPTTWIGLSDHCATPTSPQVRAGA
jgi:hypothetical protein